MSIVRMRCRIYVAPEKKPLATNGMTSS